MGAYIHNFQYTSRRRLLLPYTPAPVASPNKSSFDANVVMVLSVLLCALICSLGLNSIIRCALRCVATPSSSSSSSSSNTGIKKKALKMFPIINYAAAADDLNYTDCPICLSEFSLGDKIRLLPSCHHGFHVRCIDTWLASHSSCPTCRHCLIHTCDKIVPNNLPLSDNIVITIHPLQPEPFILNHHQT